MKKWRKRIVRFVIYGFILLIVLLGAGFIYQEYGERQDAKTFIPLGKLYEINGGQMHLSTGGQGNTTVVFAAGWGTANSTVDFYPLVDGLAPHVKYAVYDRFGYGYSDIVSTPRDVDTIVGEIHELLSASGQKPPYVLVGHSLGALEVLRYAQKYPDEVKGIVMVEGGSPEYYASRKPLTVIPIVQQFLVKTGVARVLYQFDGFAESLADQRNELKLLPNSLKELDRVSTLLKGANKNMTDEIRKSRSNGRTIMAGTKPLPIPITVLTADYFGKLADDKAWMDYEATFLSWSSSGKQIIVPETSHYLHHYKPDVVIKEILDIAL